MGIGIGTLYETIVAVYDGSGAPHASPAGARVLDRLPGGQLSIEVKLFTTSGLHGCLAREKCCVVHFPSDERLDMFLLGFKWSCPGIVAGIADGLAFSPAATVHAPRIDTIPAYIEARVARVQEEDVHDAIVMSTGTPARRDCFLLESTRVSESVGDARPITRWTGLFMEFLVDASRLTLLDPGDDYKRAVDLLQERLGVMKRLAPGEPGNGVLERVLGEFLKGNGSSGDR